MQTKFLVVSSTIPQIFVAGMVLLVAETVVNFFVLVVCQLLFKFVAEIAVLPYAAIKRCKIGVLFACG